MTPQRRPQGPALPADGEQVMVEADVFAGGHAVIAGVLLWRPPDLEQWTEMKLQPLGNDRWRASLPVERVGALSLHRRGVG